MVITPELVAQLIRQITTSLRGVAKKGKALTAWQPTRTPLT
jgi:hypothetical protein